MSDPILGTFDRCRTKDVHVIAEYYGISVSASLPKAELLMVLLSREFSAPRSGPDQEMSAPDVKEQAVNVTPVVQHEGTERQPVTWPPFEPMSVDSSPGSKLDARLRVRLIHLQVEREAKRNVQLRRELELKFEAETALKMRHMETQGGL